MQGACNILKRYTLVKQMVTFTYKTSECNEIENTLKLADLVTFLNNISSKVKKILCLVHKQSEKTMLMLLIVLWNVATTFSNFQEGWAGGVHRFFPLYTTIQSLIPMLYSVLRQCGLCCVVRSSWAMMTLTNTYKVEDWVRWVLRWLIRPILALKDSGHMLDRSEKRL